MIRAINRENFSIPPTQIRKESFDRLVEPTYAAMGKAKEAGDEQGEIDAVEAYATMNEMHRSELIGYAKQNIGSSIALYGTMLRWTGDENINALDELVSAFENANPDLHMATSMRRKVDRFKKVDIGAKSPEIELIDQNCETQFLSEIKAQYVLIDFWASWCGPCILQAPDLQKAHANYGDKGFEILSISLDDDEACQVHRPWHLTDQVTLRKRDTRSREPAAHNSSSR